MSRSLLTLDNRDIFKPFVNDFIGFESLFNQMNDVFNSASNDTNNFPPFDIYQENTIIENDKDVHNEWHTFIRIALAGFSKDEIGVKFDKNILTISDKEIKKDLPERKYIRKGIAERHFCIQKTISNDLELIGAKWEDGCLIIEFKPKDEKEKESQYIEIQ